jgi:chorismate mutase-like protein
MSARLLNRRWTASRNAVCILFAISAILLPSPVEGQRPQLARNAETNAPVQLPYPYKRLKELIQQRLDLMTEVAKAKWNSGSSIEDPAREQQLLSDATAMAVQKGLPPEWVQHFFRLQIEAAKEVQYRRFAEWTAERHGRFQQTLDLRTELRPKLDQLTSDLLQNLAENWDALKNGDAKAVAAAFQGVDETSASRLAFLPFWDGSVQAAVRPTLPR